MKIEENMENYRAIDDVDYVHARDLTEGDTFIVGNTVYLKANHDAGPSPVGCRLIVANDLRDGTTIYFDGGIVVERVYLEATRVG